MEIGIALLVGLLVGVGSTVIGWFTRWSRFDRYWYEVRQKRTGRHRRQDQSSTTRGY